MDDQRSRARAGAGRSATGSAQREAATALAGEAGFETAFVGYETTDAETTIGAVAREGEQMLVKLVESPFYATGGGQVADVGTLECEGGGCRAQVADVLRIGADQVLALTPEHGTFAPGERVHAHVDRRTRHATACNHTATHLLHASLRRRLGSHVHQAGSYVGPDKLRFDFTHSSGLSAADLEAVQDDVNRWILESHPVRAISTTLDEAKRLGAMALFNEKYGDVVRMVEVGDDGVGGGDGLVSRELCGGTHVRGTAEIGLFRILAETSSAANVRRIEAITGPEAVSLARERDRELGRAAHDPARPARARLRDGDGAARAGARARARGPGGAQRVGGRRLRCAAGRRRQRGRHQRPRRRRSGRRRGRPRAAGRPSQGAARGGGDRARDRRRGAGRSRRQRDAGRGQTRGPRR